MTYTPSPLSDTDTFDHIILYCQRHGLYTKPVKPKLNTYNGNPVVVGKFAFDCNSHSTGNSVQIWLIHKGQSRQIVSMTYWFTRSYTHNSYTWESGAWDDAFGKAMDKMTRAVAKHKKKIEKEQAILRKEREEREKLDKKKWERLFK